MSVPVQRWETRVIHLNVNPAPQGRPRSKPPVEEGSGDQQRAEQPQQPQQLPPQSQALKAIFSEDYLKQEFPNHYPQGTPPDKSAAPQHPATQLQNFINKFGQEGWEFMGINTIGQLVLMFFRRPLPPGVDQPSMPASLSPGEQHQPVPDASSTPPPSPTPPVESGQEALLQQILKRLDAIEAKRPADPASSPSSSAPEVLGPELQAQLPDAPLLPTARAAEALGLRSAGGLLTYGARFDYPIGLVKRTNSGMVAVYHGTEQRSSGGKPIRLWKVLPVEGLPQ